MTTILLTGSEGNLGSYVRAQLERSTPDAQIIRVSRTKRADYPNGMPVGDLQDSAFVASLFEREHIDYVIHLAAQTYQAKWFKEHPYELYAHDLGIQLNLLAHAKNVKKFVYGSSALVYESSTETPFTEEQTQRIPPPKSSYGLSKLAGEKALEIFHAQYGIPYTIWRPFNIVSPLEPHTEGGHVFVDFYRKIFVERQERIEIFGGGTQVRCFAWVEDIAQALAEHVFDTKTDNQVFNIGNTEPITLRDLCELLITIGKEHNLLPASYAPEIVEGGTFAGVDSAVRIPSLAKIEQELGWHATTSVRDTFTKFILAKNL